MKQIFRAATLVALLAWSAGAAGQQQVRFPSSDDNGPGQPATVLDGYLYRAPEEGRHPALVAMHGCGGMFSRTTGLTLPGYRDWMALLNANGYTVLLVDSFGPRQHGEMCSIGGFDLDIYRKRPRDAFGALIYLQAQPFISADRVGLIGWSQGGGVTLYAIGAQSRSRPAQLPQGDFRAAVAFYPASCRDKWFPGWTSTIPLLVLMGAEDVWTPMPPCQEFLNGAIGRGARIETQTYPGAYHSFDAPNQPRRELPAYVTRDGVVPIVATDPAARADAMVRVPAFLARFIRD